MFVEDEYTELKISLTKDIKKEIVAFANTKGGKIYIGIDDDGKVVGLNNIKEDIEALSGMIREGIKSDLTLYTNIEQTIIEGKNVIVLNVMEGVNKPYYLSDKGLKTTGVYLRYGNTSAPASEEVIKKLIVESQNVSFESIVSKNQNLNFEYLNNIFRKHNIELDDNKYKTLNLKSLDGMYTNLGLLLSDECPFSIKCAIFNGNNKLEFQDRKEFNGSLLNQVSDAFEYLSLFNRTKGKIVGLERIDIKDYPEFALRETLLNAVIHRDYNFSGSILISLFDDRIEITSLGGLVKGIDIEDIYNGISETRNPDLANIFYRLKYVESFGTGIERIIDSYRDFDMKPVFINTENTFKVILYNINYKASGLEKNDDIKTELHNEGKILEFLKINHKINRLIIEKILNVSSTSAKKIIKDMLNRGILKLVGSGKNTYYILNE